MIIERTINNVELAVNTSKPNEIYFEKSFLQKYPQLKPNLSISETCDIISNNKFYPLLLTWELLDKCSFTCPFCYIVGHSHKRIVRFKDMKPHLKDLIDRGLLYCTLTGGETLLHPDFSKIYKFLKAHGVIVEIYTNASLLNESHIKLFKKFPPYKVEITIYGLSKAQFRAATGSTKFDHEKILNNILLLKENGITVFCKTPLNKATQSEFDDIKQWCQENDVTFYYSTNVNVAYDGIQMEEYEVEFANKIKYEAEKILSLHQGSPDEFLSTTPHGKTCYTCEIRNHGMHINSGFELMPCSETHLDETKSNILDVGIDSAILKYRSFVEKFIDKPITGCIGCAASVTCKMCSAGAIAVRDSDNKITGFKLPEGHCDTERKKYKAIVNSFTTKGARSLDVI